MKVVIFAGGLGTRMGADTALLPKPMVRIGSEPLLWHVMQRYAKFGFTDFIICLGHRGEKIREYFLNFNLYRSDLQIDLGSGVINQSAKKIIDWKVTLVDTGEFTSTAGRLRRIKNYIDEPMFFLTYGDGLSDINIDKELEFHRSHGLAATVLAVPSPSRFGELQTDLEDSSLVRSFAEKPNSGNHLINGGYFILNSSVFEMNLHDDESWEDGPLRTLAQSGELRAFTHNGFWQPCDTPAERNKLETVYSSKEAPWLS
jgi:glucose-1-phosphate cytidylyltransferase